MTARRRTRRRYPVRGAFLSGLDEHGTADWRRAVRDMHQIGMDVAIIQTEAYLAASAGTWTLDAVAQPLIDAVLDEAARYAMRVFVGLALAEGGNGDLRAASDRAFVTGVIEQSLESATRLRDRHGASPAFAGFYLPLETWTPGSRGELGLLPDYLGQVSRCCRSLAPSKEIVISPFISDLATDPKLTETTYAGILAASEVDVVMLQDGVGARDIAVAAFETRVKPYLVAMKAAAEAAGRQMWVNAESFAGNGPAPRERFQAQVKMARSVTPSVVTFDYTSYRALLAQATRISRRPSPKRRGLRTP